MLIHLRVSETARHGVSRSRSISLVTAAVVFAALALLLTTSVLSQQDEWQQVKNSLLKTTPELDGEDSFGKMIRRSGDSAEAEEEEKQATFNYTPFIVGVVSAACLLSLGIGIGYCLPQPVVAGDVERVDAEYVLNLLSGVGIWTRSLGEEMQEMRGMVDELADQVATEQSESSLVKNSDDVNSEDVDSEQANGDSSIKRGSDIDKIVAQLSSANARLQQRIEAAELSIKSHEADVVSYMNEVRRDSLTNLPNRRAFDDQIAHRLAEWRRYGVPVSLLMVDIDFFKSFNDQYGHLAGDSVLRDVSAVMAETMRDSDIVTRYGGEEFAVILPSSGAGEACLAAERLRLRVEEQGYEYEGQQLHVTISCGAAQAMSSDDAESLMRRSDEALYAAKEHGRNRAYLHDGDKPVSIYDYLGTTPEVARSTVSTEDSRTENTADSLQVPSELNSLCDDLRRRLLEIVDQS